MTGLDTNILVRYITQDGDEAPLATRHIESRCTRDRPGFLCLVVLCELVWVLRGAYGYTREDVAHILDRVLSTAEFEMERSSLAWRALQRYRQGPADFADYVIAETCAQADATPVATLDRKAARCPLFRLLQP